MARMRRAVDATVASQHHRVLSYAAGLAKAEFCSHTIGTRGSRTGGAVTYSEYPTSTLAVAHYGVHRSRAPPVSTRCAPLTCALVVSTGRAHLP
jgi:hypothetical protein